MMENLQKKPSKGILKSSSSFEQQTEVPVQQRVYDFFTYIYIYLIVFIIIVIIINTFVTNRVQSTDKDIKWDEMNIMQTLHPADKDYGHMKIEEPKTPYNYYNDNTDGEHHSDNECDPFDANALVNKLTKKALEMPQILGDSEESDEESDENLTEEEKRKKKEFEVKRKIHYNEFQAVKLARKLLEEEGDEDEDEEEDGAKDGAAADPENGTKHENCEAIDAGIERSGVERIEHIESGDRDEVENR